MTDEPSVTSDETSAPLAFDRSAARAASLGIRARTRTLKEPGFDWDVVKGYRDAGRPGIDQQKDSDESAIPLPQPDGWSSYLESGPTASADFMENVEDLPVQKRE